MSGTIRRTGRWAIGTRVTDDPTHPGTTTSTGRRVARAGAAGAVVATAAVAVLQVMQQTIGAFDPRPVVSVLIVVAVFLAGLCAARLRQRRNERDAVAGRDAELRRILGIWPAEELADIDALRLGVFPARRDLGTATPYVERAIDTPLRAALGRPGAVVLVSGPARAGKSRTALEAVAAAVPAARVLIPRGPRALSDLLALDPPIDLGDLPTVVWLDDLERFAGTLDAVALDQLQELTRGSTVVTTVRTEDWQELLAQSGARGETARALAARAQAFELPVELSDGEREAAARAYPGLDVAGGIGPAIAARGTDALEPALREEPEPSDRDPVPAGRRDPQLVLPLAGALGAVAAFALVWALAGFSTPPPPTIGEQVGAIKRDGSRGGRHVTVYAPVDLQGSGDKSYLFQFTDVPGAVAQPRSDELRVYDVRGTKLVERLRFEPAGPRAVFQYRSSADVDQDGQAEIVGGYGEPGEARQALVPFAINWDDEAQRYRLVSLDLGEPAFSRPADDVPERQYRAVYAAPMTLRDPRNGLTITGHRVQDFVVTGAPRRLVAGYFLQPPLSGQQPVFELHPSILDSGTGEPHLTPCVLRGKPVVVVRGDTDRLAMTVVEEGWATASRGRLCGPR